MENDVLQQATAASTKQTEMCSFFPHVLPLHTRLMQPSSIPVCQANHSVDFDAGSALVLTIESTLITACSSESLVSKGHFKNFCIRFAEGFETSWDDWKPEVRGDLVMNACEWHIHWIVS